MDFFFFPTQTVLLHTDKGLEDINDNFLIKKIERPPLKSQYDQRCLLAQADTLVKHVIAFDDQDVYIHGHHGYCQLPIDQFQNISKLLEPQLVGVA